MRKEELTPGIRTRCWWMDRTLYYTGDEWDHTGYNLRTGDRTPEHLYEFEDPDGTRISLTDEQIADLEID